MGPPELLAFSAALELGRQHPQLQSSESPPSPQEVRSEGRGASYCLRGTGYSAEPLGKCGPLREGQVIHSMALSWPVKRSPLLSLNLCLSREVSGYPIDYGPLVSDGDWVPSGLCPSASFPSQLLIPSFPSL